MEKSIYKEDIEDLYQNAPFGYFSIQHDGRIVKANRTLLKWLNYESEALVNQKSFQDLLEIGGKIYFETHMIPLLQMDGEVSAINLELITMEGTRLPVLLNGSRVHKGSGSRPIYRFSVLDISQRKLYEQELLIARKKADERTQMLRQVNEELEQFSAIASHDLQAPLNTIVGLISLMEKKGQIPEGVKAKKSFSLIKSNVNRMRLMIKDLLEHTKIDQENLKFENVSLEEVCKIASESIRAEVEKNNAVFEISEMPFVKGNKTQLVRLFENLFSNAIKYRSEKDPEIKVSYSGSNEKVTVCVQDNGMGFEEKYAEHIFGFMKRLHGHDQIPGTGIGLASCKKIVELHGGEIGAKSESGKGSTFFFTLPMIV